jgi:amidohydrolase
MSVHDDAVAMRDELGRLRRRLHAEPEIGLDLPRTQEKVLAALDGLPLEMSLGNALSSVTAVLRAPRPGPVVLLRADMDALPVQERTGLDYASRVDGAMHACGHDMHTTMLVGAAHLLAARQQELSGDVILMFQPGEEGWDGSAAMIAEGVLDSAGRRPAAAYALHVFGAAVPHGTFAARPGTTMAASDSLEVTVVGSGGHGGRPHRARDPIPVTCEIVTALQTLVTRRSDIFDPVVLTVGSLHAGTRRNVIPDSARFEATLRTFSAPAKARMKDAATALVESIAGAHGLRSAGDGLRSQHHRGRPRPAPLPAPGQPAAGGRGLLSCPATDSRRLPHAGRRRRHHRQPLTPRHVRRRGVARRRRRPRRARPAQGPEHPMTAPRR